MTAYGWPSWDWKNTWAELSTSPVEKQGVIHDLVDNSLFFALLFLSCWKYGIIYICDSARNCFFRLRISPELYFLEE